MSTGTAVRSRRGQQGVGSFFLGSGTHLTFFRLGEPCSMHCGRKDATPRGSPRPPLVGRAVNFYPGMPAAAGKKARAPAPGPGQTQQDAVAGVWPQVNRVNAGSLPPEQGAGRTMTTRQPTAVQPSVRPAPRGTGNRENLRPSCQRCRAPHSLNPEPRPCPRTSARSCQAPPPA